MNVWTLSWMGNCQLIRKMSETGAEGGGRQDASRMQAGGFCYELFPRVRYASELVVASPFCELIILFKRLFGCLYFASVVVLFL